MEEKPLWQTDHWQAFQQALGNHTQRLQKVSSKALLITYPLFKKWSYGYIPRGPQITDGKDQEHFLKELQFLCQKNKLAFVKIDPPVALPGPIPGSVSSHSVQPETTLVLDLKLSEEELLKQMKRKGRYNIQLAEKKGVVVTRAKNGQEKEQFAEHFYQLLQETTERDAFSGHGLNYYKTMLKTLPEAEIYLAKKDDQVLASGIFTYQKLTATYYYGASSNQKRELMAPYLLQWTALLEAKKRGCIIYDFLGIAPDGSGDDHPWAGITSFKKKFGGRIHVFPQAIDIVQNKLVYKLYKIYKYLKKMFP